MLFRSSLSDLIAFAKANPDKLNYGSAGIGSTQHLGAEMLKLKANISLTHVPYAGNAPALTDLLSGQVEMMFVELGTALPHYAAGTLRPLGVGSAKRVDALPEVPAINETVPGVVTDSWMAIAAPPGTPAPIARKLATAFQEMLREPDVVQKLKELVTVPIGGSPEEMTALVREDSARWGEIVRATKARAQ